MDARRRSYEQSKSYQELKITERLLLDGVLYVGEDALDNMTKKERVLKRYGETNG